jgi:hypothetical protein
MRKLLCPLVISAQARTGGPAFFVCTSEHGTGAADLYVAKKRGKTAKNARKIAVSN